MYEPGDFWCLLIQCFCVLYQLIRHFECSLLILAQGGGWGYSQGSVEAIRFSPDQDILLGGYGLFGGRGSYNAEIRVSTKGWRFACRCVVRAVSCPTLFSVLHILW